MLSKKVESAPENSTRLRYGPYSPPRVRVGDEVLCEAGGLMRVHSWSDRGAIMWPRGIRSGQSPGAPSLIVMGDLVKAVEREAALAVAKHWKCSAKLVSRWRRVLEVGRMTQGSLEVAVENGRPEIAALAAVGSKALNSNPASKAKRAASQSRAMQGRPFTGKPWRRIK